MPWIKPEIENDTEVADTQTMDRMSNDEYREYLENGLIFMDLHDVLHSYITGHPIAANREQLDILIELLQEMRLRFD